MTPIERVRRARGRLAGAVVLAALLWAAAAAMAVIDLAALVALIAPLPVLVRAAIIPLVILAALVAGGIALWRGRAARSVERVALWIEEHEPSLQYALVTAIDTRIAPVERHAELHRIAEGANVEAFVGRAWRRTVGQAVLLAMVAGGVLAILRPSDLLEGAVRGLPGLLPGGGPPAPMANRLADLTARVEPPAYARLRTENIDEPTSVSALIGSRVTFTGKGPAEGVTGGVEKDTLRAASGERGWFLRLMMPKEPAVFAMHDRAYKRLVVLDPRTDSAPTVRLQLPLHDTTYQTVPKGKLVIEAEATDDIGLAYGYMEYILSTGSEESFETKQSTGPRVQLGNAHAATLRAVIDFDTLGLKPGSVLHIRTVAFDYNDVTGPGKGISETRTLRVAEPIDSTSINAAPPLPIDSMWISQRLLNMKTDTLIRTKRKLKREEFVHKSSGYSNAQEDIRKRALAVVALLEDNGVGGSFETETSKKLREAADLMWTAREHLAVAEPDSAYPYMKKILAILDEIRLANRYHMRGLLAPVAVNIERVRLTGTEKASTSARNARDELHDQNAALAARLDVAAALAHTAPQAALDSLTYIRVAALTKAPAVAAALGQAITALQKGAPADDALALARRALEPRPRFLGGSADWGGVMP